jgi:PAS domain S-box-containing protein
VAAFLEENRSTSDEDHHKDMNNVRAVWERFKSRQNDSRGQAASGSSHRGAALPTTPAAPEPNATINEPAGSSDPLPDESKSSRVREAIYRIAELANSTGSLADLYKGIHQILEGLMPARNFYIALYEPKTETVSFPYFVDEFDPPPTTSESLRGLTGYIYKTGEPLLVTPEVFDQLVAEGAVESVGAPSIDWMGVPLKVESNTIGVMVMLTYQEVVRYTPEDLNILKFVSNQVAMAIDRQYAVEKLKGSEERFRTLFENSPVGIYQTTSDGKISMVNPALVKMLGLNSLDELLQRDLKKDGFTDPKAREHFLTILNQEGFVLGVESEWMKSDGSVIYLRENARKVHQGDVYFIEGTVEDFTDKKLSEIRLVRSAEEISVLHEVAVAATEEDNEDSFIARCTRMIGTAVYSDHFGILLYDPVAEGLRPHSSYHGVTAEDLYEVVPLGAGITGRVAQTGQPVLLSDVNDDPGYLRANYPPMRSELCVPLKAGEKVFGVVNAENSNPRAFTSSDLHLMTILAGTIATAIDRYRTLAAERVHTRQLATLYEIGREIVGATLDPEAVYLAIHHAVAKVMPCEALVIGLKYDDECLDAVYAIDKSGRFPLHRLPLDHSLGGQVIRTGVPIFISDFSKQSPQYEVVHYGDPEHVNSILVVPLRLGSEIIGSLSAQSYQVNGYTAEDLRMLELLGGYAAIALGNSRLYKETLLRAEELSVLVRVSSALRIASKPDEMFPIILDQICSLLKISSAALALIDPIQGEAVIEQSCGAWKQAAGLRIPPGAGVIGRVIEDGKPAFNLDLRQDDHTLLVDKMEAEFIVAAVPLLAQEQTIGALWVGFDSRFKDEDCRLLTTVSDIAANAINRSMLHEQTLHHAGQLAIVGATGRALAETFDIQEITWRLAQSVCDLVHSTHRVWVSLFDPHKTIRTLAYEIRRGKAGSAAEISQNRLPGYVLESFNTVRETMQPVVCQESCKESSDGISSETTPEELYVPMIVKGGVLGVIRVYGTSPYHFTERESELLALVANTAGIAIENARLFKETDLHLNRLSALRSMDKAISSSFDLRVTLNVLLDQITAQLKVDAADVLLFNEYIQALEYASGRGFRSSVITRTRLRLDEDLPGKAALERRLISLSEYPQYHLRTPRLIGEDFESYYGVPLMAKGQLKGVLEIFHRTHLEPDAEWLEFLETLAGDTAIAIDNTTLFNDLQRSNIELTLAYDTTLEGWSRLLELQRLEPEGHTQRILEMTIRMAIELNVSDAELLNIRRGVLLHDIGIMGLPRHLLQKPGPLTEEEWNVVRMHPIYAYDVLLPIAYLRLALDIPYCHHERWDGSGYPRGLKGNQIPLSARIFAVVDVWDSLRSDRPYRKAWPDQNAVEHIRSQAGILFDSQVVQVLLRMVSGD